jgi:ankyrin repeat protein
VEHGANINKENWNGETVLFRTCESGDEDLVKYLLKHGTDKN